MERCGFSLLGRSSNRAGCFELSALGSRAGELKVDMKDLVFEVESAWRSDLQSALDLLRHWRESFKEGIG